MDHKPNANKSDIRQCKTWLKQTIIGGMPAADEAEKLPMLFCLSGLGRGKSKTRENQTTKRILTCDGNQDDDEDASRGSRGTRVDGIARPSGFGCSFISPWPPFFPPISHSPSPSPHFSQFRCGGVKYLHLNCALSKIYAHLFVRLQRIF